MSENSKLAREQHKKTRYAAIDELHITMENLQKNKTINESTLVYFVVMQELESLEKRLMNLKD